MNLQYIKKIILSFVILVTSVESFAAHITGGEMFYDNLGSSGAGMTKYRITLRLFRDDGSTGASMPNNVYIGIFDYGTKQQYPNSGRFYDVPRTGLQTVKKNQSPCAFGDTILAYTMGIYTFEVDLPNNSQGYLASYETCCRISNIVNVNSPPTGGGGGGTGSIYSVKISGTIVNSGPRFPVEVFLVCDRKPFEWDFGAFDPDGDSLVYSFTQAYNSVNATSATNINPATPNASPPDYPSVPYQNGYTAQFPLGNPVGINPSTGLISGIAPATGLYVVCVVAKEYRNGILIGEHRKDLILKVGNCDFGGVNLPLNSTTCDGFTQTFQNLLFSPLNKTYYWDFGVVGITTDTSTLEMPTYTFPDTGVYIVKLVINRGEACSDSGFTKLGVFPGFFPGFITTGSCFQNPIQFTDTTKTKFGVVNTWRWDFGQLSVLNDTSRLQNPQYLYPDPGTKTVEFIVSNSKGCVDTVYKDIIVIDKPLITLPFKDTLICNIDTLQLQSSSFGNPTWSPNYRIDNIFSPTPKVNPQVTTTYKVTYNDNGCVGSDSIRVRVVDKVSLTKMPDTTVCLTDVVPLNITSDALRYLWSPPATILDPTVQDPLVEPVDPFTKYYVDAYIGKCSIRDSINVITNPYPLVDAGADKFLCYGKSVQLSGVTTGSSFKWSPLNGLTNFNTLTPTASPIKTTLYILTSVNSTGCIKPKSDTILVEVIPPILAFAGNDTSIVLGQPLQLNATGSINYLWSNVAPTAAGNFLSDYTIYNPIATLKENQTFAVIVSDDNGCLAVDTIKIVVFKSAPDIFVPTIFTPNNDGKNDRLIPIPVGLKAYDYFEIYNRWGQRMYRTSQVGVGWDGYFRGVLQDSDTYVWQVQGTDFLGKRVYKKGTAILMK
jgi:gliding motility-associated-like protein